MRIGRRLVWGSLGAGALYWLARYLQPKHSALVLQEKVVLITGASSGIGRSLAYSFARRGARVILVARRADRLEAVRREIEPYTSDVLVISADLTDDEQLQAVVRQAVDTFGRIDVLVNDAGMSQAGPLQDLDPQRIERLLRLNLWTVIRLTQLVLPTMLQQSSGYIMNIGSSGGRIAVPLFAPYVAAKYGVSGFTDALRREIAGTGIYLTLVLPGFTNTDMLNPEMLTLLERYGYRIEHPDAVAERAIVGLIRGENEVVLGGLQARLGVFAERHAPLLLRLYWRLFLTPEWRAGLERLIRS
jgi:short-subunit dehydrogenase